MVTYGERCSLCGPEAASVEPQNGGRKQRREMEWRIELLGGLRATCGEQVITHFRTQKTGALLAYLAYHSDRPHPREELMELLWPEHRLEPARMNLSQALSALRRQFDLQLVEDPAELLSGPSTINPQPSTFLRADRAVVQVNRAALTTDVAEFEAALQAAPQGSSRAARIEGLVRAVELYQGVLLPGYYEDWILQERQWLEERYFQALGRLLADLEEQGEVQQALCYAHQGVSIDPLREEAHRDLIRLYALAGQPGAALRQYETLERLLKEQLDLTPDAATQSLRLELERLGEAARRPLAGAETVSPVRMGAGVTVLSPPGQRLVLVYRRRAQPDEQILEMLEARLSALGHRVFVDQHLTVGVEWAREIEHEIWSADAVIPLLSEAAIPSEMLAYEIQTAQEAARMQGGRPRLLPVRVNYTGPLPEPLAAILDPLEYVLWQSAQDDERLIEALLRALRDPVPAAGTGGHGDGGMGRAGRSVPPSPPRPVTSPPAAPASSASGVLPPDSAYYVVRPIDRRFQAAIGRGDSIVLVKGAGQMGKSSLLARGLQHAREAGARVVLTPFQTLAAADLESSERLFYTLAGWIADQLDRDVWPEEFWDPRLGASVNFERYLRREVLGKIEAPIVWGLDEVDRLFPYDCSNQVFGLFRSWHNRRGLDPTGPWSRLTLVMAYSSEAHLFITDANQSPFNIGVRFALDEFTLDETADLNGRYRSPLRDREEIAAYQRLLGGHPFLVHRGLREMATQGLDLAALEAEADRDEGIFGDHLKRLLVLTVKDSELLDGVRAVLCGQACPAGESFYRLRSMGILTGETAQEARLRCPLYATYLERHLR